MGGGPSPHPRTLNSLRRGSLPESFLRDAKIRFLNHFAIHFEGRLSCEDRFFWSLKVQDILGIRKIKSTSFPNSHNDLGSSPPGVYLVVQYGRLTMSGRENIEKPEFMSDEDWATILDQTSSLDRIRSDGKADVEDYLANPKGRATGEGPSGLPTLLLTSIGRKSGKERTVALVFMQHGEEYVVVGSLAGYDNNPAWCHNVAANPDCWVQLDDRKMTAIARSASDAEREELWPKLNELFAVWGHFQKQTDRPFPIVILKPTGPA